MTTLEKPVARRFKTAIRIALSLAFAGATGIMQISAASSNIDYSCWQKTFADEFDNLSLRETSSGTWTTAYTWGDGGINNEKQYYADPRQHGVNPFLLKNGLLHIQAKPTLLEVLPRVAGMNYTSGLLTTEKSFDQIYGLFEIRARLPSGKGLWPAFWLLPTDKKKWRSKGYGRLPEIDIMEALGHEHSRYHATLHTKTPPNQKGSFNVKHTEVKTGVDLSQGFHVYGLSWDKNELVWYFDGKVVKRESTPPDSQDDAKYLLINLAVGGNWPGNPDAKTRFPANYTLDWVRVYSRNDQCPPG